jgi:hypothetical protein
MDTATTQAVPKTYIAEWINLDFFNNSNLKTDIQNRISVNIEANFLNALNDMRGDNKNGYGISFSEITRLALAYFYSEIFTDKIKDNYYTLEMVKGFLDVNNLTTYTAIHEIDVPFYALKDAPLFKHCWLIVQSAWFFNSEYFGHHQHIEYVNHYINTGQMLSIENYKYDADYLQKKYDDIDSKKKEKIPINGFTLVNQWYFGILFLICKELQLSTKHFNISVIDNREYNPLPKTSRQLRPLAPFKVIECDIKSAFPTFLDIETGANLKDYIYNNLMQAKGITRTEAKILFNTICNSSKYKSKEFTTAFFRECGYTLEQCEILIKLTHDPKRKFISFMTEYECLAIQNFAFMNNLQRGARLHDAVLFIDDKTKPQILTIKPNVDFGYKELNRPVIKETFNLGKKHLPYAYVGSIPQGLNLISKHENTKADSTGTANGFIFYAEKFQYINAGFNLNNQNEFGSYDNFSRVFYFKDKPNSIFITLCQTMLDTLFYLNKRKIKPIELELILKHIRRYSNYIFNVRAVYLQLIKYNPTLCATVKERDFDITKELKFKKKIDFLKAMNEAKKTVNVYNNYKDLIDLMQERITNNDFGFMNENRVIGKKRNNLLVFAITHKFNKLCSDRKNKPIFETLFINSSIKRVQKTGLSDIELKKERAKENRNNLKIKKVNELIEQNKQRTHQLYFLLCSVAGADTNLEIIKNDEVQNELKHELIQEILKLKINNIDAGVNCFDFLYRPPPTKKIEFNNDLENSFDTDLSKSIFNQLTMEQAQNKDPIFLKEYLKFHKVNKRKQAHFLKQKQKEQFEFSIINFD